VTLGIHAEDDGGTAHSQDAGCRGVMVYHGVERPSFTPPSDGNVSIQIGYRIGCPRPESARLW
jgi:hypothetical protein